MTGVIQQMVAVIEQTYDLDLDSGSVSVGRFITHLRYLFVRIHQHKQLDQKHSTIGVAIREAYPQRGRVRRSGSQRSSSCASGSSLTEDEISYLALHIARVAADQTDPEGAPESAPRVSG